MGDKPHATPESEALFQLITQRYGHRLTPEELAEVRQGVEGITRAAMALRAVRLDNSTEPLAVPYRKEG